MIPLDSLLSRVSITIRTAAAGGARALGLGLALCTAANLVAAEVGKAFATPEEAVLALAAAVNQPDSRAVLDLLWPQGE